MKFQNINRVLKFAFLKVLLLASLSVTIISFSYAQPVNSYINDLALPSPNIGALTKYLDVPVDEFTGIPDISIPLCQISDGPLSVPVSLSYHAGGLKLAETASWVGMGWSLMAGGMISRQVVGYNDDKENEKGYLTNSDIHTEDLIEKLINDQDNETDVYSLTAAGLPGIKFFLDRPSGEIKWRTLNTTGIKIQEVLDQNEEISGFIITNTDGAIYTFGAGFTNKVNYEGSRKDIQTFLRYADAWYLKSIESADGLYALYFDYEEESYEYFFLGSSRYRVQFNANDNTSCDQGNSQGNTAVSDVLKASVVGYRLSAISTKTNDQIINFIATTNREDLDPPTVLQGSQAKRLDRIEFTKSTSICKAINLNYFYSNASSVVSEGKRLFLSSVQELACDGSESIPSYNFSYKGDLDDIPERTSKQTDIYGYWNGAISNDSRHLQIANNLLFLDVENNLDPFLYDNMSVINKEPNYQYAKIGSLTSIDYPTGGNTSFEFEANKIGGSLYTYNYKKVTSASISSCSENTFDNPSNLEILIRQDPDMDKVSTFDLKVKKTACSMSNPSNVLKLVAIDPEGSNINPPTFTYSFKSAFNDINTDLVRVKLSDFTPKLQKDVSYIFDLDIELGSFEAEYAYYSYLENDGSANDVVVGGQRIKRIVHDPIEGEKIITSYSYTSENKSSGKLIYPTINGYEEVVDENPGTGESPYDFFIKILNMSSSPVLNTTFLPNQFGYEKVTKEIGKDKYVNYYFVDSIDVSDIINVNIPIYQSIKNGTLLRSEVYQDQQLLSYTDYSGKIIGIGGSYGNNFKFNKYQDCRFNEGNLNSGFSHYTYITYTGKNLGYYVQDSVVEVREGVVKASSSLYDESGETTNMISSTVYNSDNAPQTASYYYADSYASGPIKDTLISKNMISIPWKTETSYAGQVIDGVSTEYTLLNGHPYPYDVYMHEAAFGGSGSNGYVPEYSLRNYDLTVGRPQSVLTYGWVDTTFFTYYPDGNIATQSFIDFSTTYIYDGLSNFVIQLTQPNGLYSTYVYDGLGRLEIANERVGTIGSFSREYDYNYSGNGNNSVKSSIIYSNANDKVTEDFFDGLGRFIEKLTYKFVGGANVITDSKGYDDHGRVGRASILPEKTEKQIFYDALNRPIKEIMPNEGVIQYEYGNSGNYYKVTVIDQLGRASHSIADILGRVSTKIDAIGGETNYSYYPNHQVNTITSPEGQSYSYTYVKNKLVSSKTIPDYGTIEIDYDIRDLPEEERHPGITLNYVNDAYGRMIEKKLGGVTIGTTSYDSYSGVTCTGSGSNANILLGKVTSEYNSLLDGSGSSCKVYQYDGAARVNFTTTTTHDGKTSEVSSTLNKADQVTSSVKVFDGVTYTYNYVYDTWDRENRYQLDVTNGAPTAYAEMSYNTLGLIESLNLGGIQCMDYTYNEMGWLRTINQPISDSYPLQPLVTCDPVTFSEEDDPGDEFVIFDERKTTIESFLQLRFDVQFQLDGKSRCTETPCEDPPKCTQGLHSSLQLYYDEYILEWDTTFTSKKMVECTDPESPNDSILVSKIDSDSLVFPYTILEVILCNRETVYVGEDFIVNYPGDYRVNRVLNLTGPSQSIEVIIEGVRQLINSVEFLDYILKYQTTEGSYFTLVDGEKSNCGELDCDQHYIDCTPSEVSAQEQIIDQLRTNTSNIDIDSIDFPLMLYLIEACNGQSFWVMDDEREMLEPTQMVIIDSVLLDEDTDINEESREKDRGDIFYQKLDYALNGRIDTQTVQIAGRSQFIYRYDYDDLDRVTDAHFSESFIQAGNLVENQDNYFGVYGIDYDGDGNIQHLNRNGIFDYCEDDKPRFGPIDKLTYTYSGNKVMSVIDASSIAYGHPGGSGGYTYDGRGNMISDGYRGVSSTYNYLNLPQLITTEAGTITNKYDASGYKWQKNIAQGDPIIIDYYEGVEYKNQVIDAIYHGHGRLSNDEGAWTSEYYMKDHLGNTRVVFSDVDNNKDISLTLANQEIFQELYYYPFGLTWEESEKSPWYKYPIPEKQNRYTYNGKEVENEIVKVVDDVEVKLGWLDYGARFYDPSIGRFTGVDPISDQFPHVSTYNYAENEPIANIDLWGLQAVNSNDIRNAQGEITSRNSTVTVNMKVLNKSKFNDFQFRSSLDRAATKASSSFKTSFMAQVFDSPEKGLTSNKVRVNVNFKLNIEQVSSFDNISDSDFIAVIVNDVKEGSDGVVGSAEMEGNKSVLESGTMSRKAGTELLLHELGHNLGLEFGENNNTHTLDGSGLMGAKLNGQTSVLKQALINIYQGFVTGESRVRKYDNSKKSIDDFVKDNSN